MTGTAHSTNAYTSFVGASTTFGDVTDVFGGHSISISTSSGGDRDVDESSPSTLDKGNIGTPHVSNDSNAKQNEDKMEIISRLNYFIAKAIAKQLRGRTSIRTTLLKKTLITRMSRAKDNVEYRDLIVRG
jgi:hypothetical protein